MDKTIVWFRKDLRLHDNQALWEALQRGIIIPIFIWSKDEELELASSEASRWWLHHSLLSLKHTLQQYGISLLIREGKSEDILLKLIEETGANAVYYNERYEPSIIKRDEHLAQILHHKNIYVRSFHSNLLFHPSAILKSNGEPYKVYTAFWKRCIKEPISRPFSFPSSINGSEQMIKSDTIEGLELLPKIRWDKKLNQYWEPGESSAIQNWKDFVQNSLPKYQLERDYPALQSVSNLSPYLAWGNISPRAIWYSAQKHQETIAENVEAFLKQLIWREFSYHQLVHFPSIPYKSIRTQYEAFPWENKEEDFIKWKSGKTGYPLVDAGMRELWETGTMHNRVRMVVASFLVKHLLIPWTKGAEWFQHTLVDFDLANNSLGWQWVSGSGFDAAPYFRIFNPITQSEKYDKNGEYIRKWVPELEKLPSPYIHRPWEAPQHLLISADVILGEDYPLPIIDHTFARKRALHAYEMIK